MYWMCVIYKSDVCTNSFDKGTDTLHHALARSIHTSVVHVMFRSVNIL